MPERTQSRFRFVVLRHEGIDQPHFDLMFETAPGSMLRTWRAENWPPAPQDVLLELREHRRAYLDYQGAISGDRGFVTQVESGDCVIERNEPDAFCVRCEGARQYRFTREQAEQWRVDATSDAPPSDG